VGAKVMKVDRVTATLRYSAEAKGAWRSIEVGAEAALTNSDGSWEQAQADLYQKLGQHLKTLWANGNGKAEAQEQQIAETPALLKPHWCSEHNQEWEPKNGKYGTFYNHKAPDGSWCNEGK
jgi:hypothetical protein